MNEAVARRLFKAAAARLTELQRDDSFELLAVGGNQGNIDALLAELPAETTARLAGTFVSDPRTITPAEILERCREIAAEHDRLSGNEEVQGLMDAAGSGGRAVLGLGRGLSRKEFLGFRHLVAYARLVEDLFHGVYERRADPT